MGKEINMNQNPQVQINPQDLEDVCCDECGGQMFVPVMLFKKIGIVIEVEKESKLDTFTGMIGSGPAYFFYLLKSYEKKLIPLCDGDKDKANYVMVNLIKGIGMSVENNKDLNKLIAAVASKKGTTEAGLKSFKSNNLDKVFEEGISAAIKRSKEISNEF